VVENGMSASEIVVNFDHYRNGPRWRARCRF